MRRYVFPVLLGVAGVAVLTSLGFWQLRRMEEKRVYIAEIEAQIAKPPVALPAAPDEATDKFQAVVVEGSFTGEFVEVLSAQKDIGPGVLVIEAFVLSDGRRVLVQRGFLPDAEKGKPLTAAEARVEGHLHWPQDASSSTPPPDERTGLWFARDVDAMAKALDTEATFIVASGPTGDGIAPTPVDSHGIPDNHWAYAVQWFLLAVTWAGMTVFLLWRIRSRTA